MLVKAVKDIRMWLRQYPLMRKFIKFGIVGVTATLVSLAAFWFISLQYPQYNLLAKAIGYIMGFFVGFTLNKFWTYIDQAEDGEKYLLRYIVVYLVTFAIFLVFNYVCDHWLHPNMFFARMVDSSGQSKLSLWLVGNGPNVSILLSIVLNVFLNFFGTNYLVFKVPEPDKIFD